MKRRVFIKNIVIGSSSIILPLSLNASTKRSNKTLKFGVCADVHNDVMHDGIKRIGKFIGEAQKRDLDFIIQLGDFCRPYPHNQIFLDTWNSYSVEKFHVLGNHDMDGGFSREQVLEFWGASQKYYSIDKDGFHIIVLDGNDKNPSPNKATGYARFIGEVQKQWLKEDLSKTDKPCIVFSHQTLENNNDGIENRADIRDIFTTENSKAGFKKVIACFSGHHHTDYATQVDDIYYIQINSMSYEWLGEDYETIRYSKEIDEKYEWIKYTVPYKDPLFAFVKIEDASIIIKGVQSSFVGPSPKELGVLEKPENNRTTPNIIDRKLHVSNIN